MLALVLADIAGIFGAIDAMAGSENAETGLRKAKILFGTIVVQRILVTTIEVNTLGSVGFPSLLASAVVVLLFLALIVNGARIAGIAAGAILVVAAVLDFAGAVVLQNTWYTSGLRLTYLLGGLVQLACGLFLLLDRDIREFSARENTRHI